MYKAILFSISGDDWVTDYRGQETITEVEELLANQGSRWIFYPWTFVIVDNQFQDTFNKRIRSVPMWPQELQELENCTVRTVQKWLKRWGVDLYNAIS
jgi:DNA-directed RNA polymerase specialized sigma24 family protein